MHNTRSTIIFVLIMTSIVALLLSIMYTGLKPIHLENEAIYNKKAILAAIADKFEVSPLKMSNEEVQKIFEENVKQTVLDMDGNILSKEDVMALGYKGGEAEHVDMAKEVKKPEADRVLPLYEYDANGEKFYILSVRGNGLWDAIWGNIALGKDLNTIAGVSFDHKAETPGLGAEIKDNADFSKQFRDKKFFGPDGEFKSVYVRKGGATDDTYEVDGISGATITADGVSEMLDRGIRYYIPYLKTLKG